MPKLNEFDLRKRLAVREPEILRTIGEESKLKGTNTLSSRQIDGIIKRTRCPERTRRHCLGSSPPTKFPV